MVVDSFGDDTITIEFNYGEFAIIESRGTLRRYKVSIKEWTE
jgi:hypothetical protein